MDLDQAYLEEVNQWGNQKASSRKASKSPYKGYVFRFTVYLTIITIFKGALFKDFYTEESIIYIIW